MSKTRAVDKQKAELEEEFDFFDPMEFGENEIVTEMMRGMIEASHQQQKIAIELTKLVLEKSTIENLNEENIFSLFEQSTIVVAENSPLKDLWKKFN